MKKKSGVHAYFISVKRRKQIPGLEMAKMQQAKHEINKLMSNIHLAAVAYIYNLLC